MKKEIFDGLLKAAQAVRVHSYSPISKFRVGAAFLTVTGNIYAGTNIEEAAFNASVHAEASAIAQMVAKEGRVKITHLVVIGGTPGDGLICAPCGHCRQLLLEFADDNLEITAADPEGGVQLETTLGALIPYAFRMGNLL